MGWLWRLCDQLSAVHLLICVIAAVFLLEGATDLLTQAHLISRLKVGPVAEQWPLGKIRA